ncbi:MAG: ABC transporter permease [Bacteroidetes bacterium]|nr:ABC transporter permease [Bacteroidota bacterium]
MDLRLTKKISNALVHSNSSNFLNFSQIISFCSVLLGAFALVLSLSILNGFDFELREIAKKFTSDIALHTINGDFIYNIDSINKCILQTEDVKFTTPVIASEGLVSNKNYTGGITIQSLDLKNPVNNLSNNIISGRLSFSNNNAKEIIIGQTLARKLGVKTGDKILLYALKNNENINFSSVAYAQFTINAVYHTGMLQYDETVVFCPMNTLGKLLEMPENTASYFEIYIKDINKVDDIVLKLEDQLGYPFFPISYYDMNQSIFAWIELQKEPIPIVLAIISFVAILNIITTLIITVVEKTRSIGILQTLGLKRNSLVKIFVFQGIRTTILGSVVGCLLALILCILQMSFGIIKLDSTIYFLDSLPIKLEFWYFAVIIGTTTLLALLASFIPARIAVKITPLQAIKFK